MSAYALTPEIVEATARLLDDRHWRRRVVEKVVPLTADHYELRRSFQFEIPIQTLEGLDSNGRVDALLPVCWMPKEPFLEFDLRDSRGEPLPVLDRATNALVVADILDAWRQSSQIAPNDGIDAETIVGVSRSSLAPWYQAERTAKATSPTEALRSYYENLLGIQVPLWQCEHLLAEGSSAESSIREQMENAEEIRSHEHTMLNSALLAPFTRHIRTTEELITAVQDLAAAIKATSQSAAASTDGPEWLNLLAKASAEWVVLTPMSLTPGETLLVKTVEVRNSGDRNPRVFRHRADLSAALSYHLNIHAPEPSIKISGYPSISDVAGIALDSPGVFDTFRSTDELFTAYSSRIDQPERPVHADVKIRYELYPSALTADRYALGLTLAAVGVALFFHQQINPAFAAVLLIPTTVVAGFIGTRGSVLVSSFLRRYRTALPILNVGLWIWVLILVGRSVEGT